LYSSLKWVYQPIKASQSLIRDISYIPRRNRLLQRFANADFVGLQIGCGPFYLKGWINTDLPPNSCMDFSLDITHPLPLPSNYFHVIYGAEVIEHITLSESRYFLSEALRVLCPGGVIRLTTPDLINTCRIYLHQHTKANPENFGTVWLDGEFSDEIWINSIFRSWGHQFLYSFEMIRQEMQSIGFSNITRVEPQVTKSRFPQLNNLEVRYGANPREWIFENTLIIEASKPETEVLKTGNKEQEPIRLG
ncbi:MAG: methyltransferase domain-containing protein, partial [Scytonema sp. PMC 1069.18]|nr:methyltransferase domain-containing protein [Scytonema sp. PMC 1069.18]